MIGLFLLAFLPRAVHPVSRPLQWYFRGAEFFQAVLAGDWAGTLFSEHPGVTVMWLSGAALWGWYGLQSLLGHDPTPPLATEGIAFADRVAVGVLPLALVAALGIVWGWHLLRRLFGRRVAWIGALLWALDPFYLANSSVLHLDATLSTLMLLSALSMLVHIRERKRAPLVVSAVLGGLAVLTKISALFLVPFLGLCLLVDRLPSVRSLRSLLWGLQSIAGAVLLWLLIAAVVCCLLWPALWVQPRAALDAVIRRGIVLHVEEAHALPRFHRGAVSVGDPGAGYYLDVLLFRSTWLTLPFVLVGLLSMLASPREERKFAMLIFAFAGFFFVQMALGGRKEERYMLPVLLACDVLAAQGLVSWTGRLRAVLPRLSLLLPGLLLAAQAVHVLPLHPYYGLHYNLALGGHRAAMRVLPLADFGEGLDLAGRYLDQLPNAEEQVIGTQFLANEMLAQYVRAPVYDIAQVGEGVDVLVFGVQYTTRGVDYPRWGELWQQTYRFRQPEALIAFDGIPYAWVHRPGAQPTIPRSTEVLLGESIRLLGYRVVPDEAAPGDLLLLTLYWQTEGPTGGDYTVFVHLQGPDGGLVAQRDNPPVRGTRPTGDWERGDVVEDPYEIHIPPGADPGDYTLNVGMYHPDTLERLAAFGSDGRPLADDRVPLAVVPVRSVVPWWRWLLSGAWLAAVTAGIVWPRIDSGPPSTSWRGEELAADRGGG